MIVSTTLMTSPAEPREDDDAALSSATWVSSFTGPAREALVAAQQPQPALPTASFQSADPDRHDSLSRIADLIVEVRDLLLSQRVVRDYYSTEQAAQILGKANWTVREWCRLGRVNAEKRRSGRGRSFDWVIAHGELQRIQKEGLLPLAKH